MKHFSNAPDVVPSSSDHSSTTGLSRRQILTGVGAAATYLTFLPLMHAEGSLSLPSPAFAGCSPAPVPIPGGFNAKEAFGPRFPDRFFHFFLAGPGVEPSTIFNFKGKVGVQSIQGTGTRTLLDQVTGQVLSQTPNLPFATDLRFMAGQYIGVDGRQHQGTFAVY